MNYLVQYRILKVFVRQGMIIDKVHEIFSLKQGIWIEKYRGHNTQKNQATTDFEKEFYEFLNNVFYRKTMKNVKIERKKNFLKKMMMTKI